MLTRHLIVAVEATTMQEAALIPDLYELTMAAAYFENQLNHPATFDVFIRDLPDDRGCLLTAGREQALEYLENLHFNSEQIDFLRSQPVFSKVSKGFFEYLRQVRFTGEAGPWPKARRSFPWNQS